MMTTPKRVYERDAERSSRVLRLTEALVLAAVLLPLAGITFGRYLIGEIIPPWDFLGAYNTEAYYWWSKTLEGGTPAWVPSVWGGYPSVANLQNGSWYLLVGAFAAAVPFTLHTAAILHVLHVTLGAVGIYLLTRFHGVHQFAAIFAATAWFFVQGFYANAQHVDIVRGYALIPFVVLCMSPRWPWHRVWSVPVAALVFWQFLVGVYPGMVAAAAYVLIPLFAVSLYKMRVRWRTYAIPLATAGVAAALLSMPKFLPYLMLGGRGASAIEETSVFDVNLLGTLFFPYGNATLGNDISMRSFFVPATVLVLAFFAWWGSRMATLGFAIMLPALILGLPFWPWFDLAQTLPGIGSSRFTMSDFKVFLLLGLVLLAASGLDRMLRTVAPTASLVPRLVPVFGSGSALALAILIGWIGPYTLAEWSPAVIIMLAAIGAVIALVLVRSDQQLQLRQALAMGLVSLTVISGYGWAQATPAPWQVNRTDVEIVTYGSTVDELLASARDNSLLAQRPARTPLVDVSAAGLNSVAGNAAHYSNRLSISGYVNLKGLPTASQLENSIADPSTGPSLAEFLSEPGTLAVASGSGSWMRIPERACARVELFSSLCSEDSIESLSYKPGQHEYAVSMAAESVLVANEPYYVGWTVETCTPRSDSTDVTDVVGFCTPLEVTSSSEGLLQIKVPSGAQVIKMQYQNPGYGLALALLMIGAVLPVGFVCVRAYRTHRFDRLDPVVDPPSSDALGA